MKIIVDENIPYLDECFAKHGDLVRVPGREIAASDVKEAGALLVRSITQVDQALLQGSSLKFIGSMTSGEDHIKDSCGIYTYVARGCNANAVAQYDMLCLHALNQTSGRAAVVGVGHVGSKVVNYLQQQGFEVLKSDPFVEGCETVLSEIKDCDVICVHTPLTLDGEHPTHHLIDAKFLQRQKPGCIVINAGRGAVVDFAALKMHGQHLHWCLDVWEGEPDIDNDVLAMVDIATPHIAGYSLQAKLNATQMVYHDFVRFFNLQPIDFDGDFNHAKTTFDVVKETRRMRAMLKQDVNGFDQLRKTFGERLEY